MKNSYFPSLGRLLFCWLFFAGVRSQCPQGEWQSHGGSCYLYKHELFTFFEAKVSCDIFNSHLVVINSEQENTYIKNMISTKGGDYAWIALEDLESEGTFVWYTNQEAPEYTSWLSSDPNDYQHNEDCVTSRPDGMWQDWDCEVKHPFICQKPVTDDDVVG